MKIEKDFGVKFGRYKIIVFKGSCMFPFLKEGDLLFVEETPPHKIKNGELICFKKNENFICHRLIFKRRKDGKLLFFEKPDSSLFRGSYIEPSCVIGRTIGCLRGKKEISLKENFLKRYFYILRFLFQYFVKKYFPFRLFSKNQFLQLLKIRKTKGHFNI